MQNPRVGQWFHQQIKVLCYVCNISFIKMDGLSKLIKEAY